MLMLALAEQAFFVAFHSDELTRRNKEDQKKKKERKKPSKINEIIDLIWLMLSARDVSTP